MDKKELEKKVKEQRNFILKANQQVQQLNKLILIAEGKAQVYEEMLTKEKEKEEKK